MAWGKREPKHQVQVEFDVSGRTYRVEMSQGEATPYYIGNSLINEITTKTDLLTGQSIIVIWSRVGVLRLV
jgi:hypothetical protein